MFNNYEQLQLFLSLFFLASTIFFVASISMGARIRTFHRALYLLASALFIITALAYLVFDQRSTSVLNAVLLVFYSLNALRGVYGRYRAPRLHRRLGATWWRLSALAISLNVFAYTELVGIEHLTIAGLVLSIILLTTVLINRARYSVNPSQKPLREWPTVSILVPARNEDHALHEALTNLLSIDYPKLEIIVLDDCSHDKTPEIIAARAHDGVRFIKGVDLQEGWTGKNQALQLLLNEASGEFVLFCDVDVRLGSGSLVKLMSQMLDSKLAMLSVMPGRRQFDLLPSLLASLQDYFLLALPMELFGYPPASSPCMLFDTERLRKTGGFSIVSDMVNPELYFAKFFARRQGYKLVIGTEALDVTTRKKMSSTIESRNRVLYPALQRDPATVLIVAAILIFLIPYSLYSALTGSFISSLSLCFLIASNLIIVTTLNPGAWLLSIINLPLVVLFETFLLLRSMFNYEFGTVQWKMRNICYTSLETISKLPSLNKD